MTNLSMRAAFTPKMFKVSMLFLSASLLVAGCKKNGEQIGTQETGTGGKDAATVSAPTGNPIVLVYPLRALHNHGWNSGVSSTGPYTCDREYSNEDYIGSGADAHYGNDIFCSLNAPVVSPTTGVLVIKGFHSSMGNRVVIRDANGWHHYLIHLNSIDSSLPAVGQMISAGTPVGKAGATGSASGGSVHLHYSTNYGEGYWDTGIDPFPYTYPVELAVCSAAWPTTVDSFEQYTVNTVPKGYAVPNGGFWVSAGVTPLPTGYNSTQALFMNDDNSENKSIFKVGFAAATTKTFEFKVRTKAYAPSGGAIQFCLRSGASTVFHMAVFPSGAIAYYNGSWTALPGTPVPLDTWKSIKVVANASSTAAIYVDGVLIGNAPKETASATSINGFSFGSGGSAIIGDKALFDDVRLY